MYLGSMSMGPDLAATMSDKWQWGMVSVRVGMGVVNCVNVTCIRMDESTHKCNYDEHPWFKW